MTKPIVECVPNFSEGRNKAIIDRIAAEISSVEEVRLLSVEMGASVNRTVMTFLGSPDQVKEAAFHAIRKAAELIDMRKQRGLHPRIGATDVCPLVPLRGIDMEECVALSRELGKRVGDELQIPVYLYERSAIRPERRNLADIRSGNYEELEKKLQNPDWMPDYGPTEFNPRTGATIIGARNMLIAFNINLNTKTVQYAMDIAFELREKGRSVRTGNTNPIYMRGKLVKYRPNYYPCGNCDFIGKSYEDIQKHCRKVHDYDLRQLLKMHGYGDDDPVGKAAKKPGLFKQVRAMGWYVPEYRRAQITMNLTDYRITPPHIVVEAARRLAEERGVNVTGCEVIGLVPHDWIIEAGEFYRHQQGQSREARESTLIKTAIVSMGLDDVQPFDPQQKVLQLP